MRCHAKYSGAKLDAIRTLTSSVGWLCLYLYYAWRMIFFFLFLFFQSLMFHSRFATFSKKLSLLLLTGSDLWLLWTFKTFFGIWFSLTWVVYICGTSYPSKHWKLWQWRQCLGNHLCIPCSTDNRALTSLSSTHSAWITTIKISIGAVPVTEVI